jgi:hypothetical protein
MTSTPVPGHLAVFRQGNPHASEDFRLQDDQIRFGGSSEGRVKVFMFPKTDAMNILNA